MAAARAVTRFESLIPLAAAYMDIEQTDSHHDRMVYTNGNAVQRSTLLTCTEFDVAARGALVVVLLLDLGPDQSEIARLRAL